MRRLAAMLGCLALAGAAFAVELSVAPGDTLLLDSEFPSALESHPSDPDRAFLARVEGGPGILELRIAPDQPLAPIGTPYLLPGNLNCSESSPFLAPLMGGFSLEPLPAPTRGWITTSSCELAVPFDYAAHAGVAISYAGQARMAVPARHTISGSFTRYSASGTGAAIGSFKTNLTSAALRVGNRLVVVTSNFAQAGASPVLNPGTVLFFELDDSASPLRVTPASPFFAITSDPNPVALTPLGSGRVLVTNAGLHDASFPPLITGSGSIDVLDVASGRLVGSIPLSNANPGGRSLAIDPTGSVALAGSQTHRRLYALDLRGLEDMPAAEVDPRVQRPSCNATSASSAGGVPCLRSRVIRGAGDPIVLPPPSGTGSAFSLISEVRFSESGAFAAATSFNDGGLGLVAFDARNLERPHPLLASRFGEALTLEATEPAGMIGAECCPGPMILRDSPLGMLDASQVFFATGSPNGFLVRGTFSGALPQPTGDRDGDGIEDAVDDCPLWPNPSQADAGGLETSQPDGIGDVCQCGDASGDGRIDPLDLRDLRDFLAGGLAALAAPQLCAASPGARCDLVDRVYLARALAGLAPGIAHNCEPFVSTPPP